MALLQSAEPISDELVIRLGARTVALGAETDLGVKVYRGRRYVDDTMIPCCVLLEGQDEPERKNVRATYEIVRPYAALAYLPCDPDHPNVAGHAGIRDMKRAIFQGAGRDANTLDGKVAEVVYVGSAIGPRADGAAFVVATVEFSVRYVEDLLAP